MKTKHYALYSGLFLSSLAFCGCGMSDSDDISNGAYRGYPGNMATMDMSDSAYIQVQPTTPDKDLPMEPVAFTNPLNEPQSTFAADVDTASYTQFRYRINHDINPKKTSNVYGVDAPYRTEEMINYFKYDYPEPAEGEVFSIMTEYANCPWNKDTKLLLIGTQTQKLDVIPNSNLVFLVDVSGSMNDIEKLNLLKTSLLALLPTLTSQDKLSIVTYASGEKLVLEGADPVKDRAKIEKAINSLEASGATNGERGLQMAYETAQKYFIPNGNNRIIMGTDGDLNVGISSVEELKSFVEEKRKNGIYLSILGFGLDNYNDALMETIADNGNGSYHYIDSEIEAIRVLSEDRESTLFTVAKDVKYQVSFNPDLIKGYRLIGYENRTMSAEDFTDDKKDGGEIGANHQVTVLYEIAEKDSPVAIDDYDSSLNPQMPVFNDGEMVKLAVRYKDPNGNSASVERNYTIDLTVRELSPNIAFAASIAELGMILNDSKYVGTSSQQSINSLLSVPPETFQDKYKLEFKELVDKAFTLMNKEGGSV
ncbi:MAG: von Willebrand factor type A domain-containing protein [Proteobacteria bacterium]|nr:von Willebrand factor type A domain-containing protein [Pseudomonadota bacterium]